MIRPAIPLARLHSQRLTGPALNGPLEVVRWLVASQAQDFANAKWALALRAGDAVDAEVESAFDAGTLLRTHLMRPTWHFVAQDDIRWLLNLTAPRVHAVNASMYRQLDLDARTLGKATAAIGRALAKGRALVRTELQAALARVKIDADGIRLAYILMHAELEAMICSGPRRGKQFTYMLLETRAPGARSLRREDALVLLAERYFASRGPATVQDFAKWSGLHAADARKGLEGASPKLRREERDGITTWSSAKESIVRVHGTTAHLLSIYDEYISSYRDRSAMGAPEYAKRLVAMGNALTGVVVVDGVFAGTWKRTVAKRTIRVEVTCFRRLGRSEERAVLEAAERLRRFVGSGYELELEADFQRAPAPSGAAPSRPRIRKRLRS